MDCNKIILEKVNNKYYKTNKKIIINMGDNIYIIKKGFKTDGASIPFFLRTLIGCNFLGNHTLAAIAHDLLYREGVVNNIGKVEADLFFLKIMKTCKVNIIKRYLMFLAVFFFGYFSYNTKKENIINKYLKIKKKEIKKDEQNS